MQLQVAGQGRPWVLWVFGGIALVVGWLYASYGNFFNWDLIPYMAIVLGYDGHAPAEAHRLSYQLVQQLPPDVAQALLHEVPYREQCFQDPAFFEAQLGFYRVKPLFTGMAWAAYKAGMPLYKALQVPAIVGFALLCTVTLAWLRRYLRVGAAVLVAVGILASLATQLPRLITPDALSAGLLLLFFYRWYWQPQRIRLIWLVWLLLLLCRIDHVLLALPLLAWQLYSGGTARMHGQWPRVLGAAAGVLILGLLVPVLLGNRAGWYFDFSITESVRSYVVHAGRSLRQLTGTALPLLAALVLATWPVQQRQWQWVLLGATVTLTLRWALFPTFQERFFVGYEVLACCYLVQVLAGRLSATGRLQA